MSRFHSRISGEVFALCLLLAAGRVNAIEIVLSDWTAAWRYSQDGAAPAPEWIQSEYDDSSWSTGSGCLGFPLNEPLVAGASIGTLLRQQGTNGANVRTYYFRRWINLEEPESVQLTFTSVVDDGVVIYLDGFEVKRFGINPGAVTYTNLANRTDDISNHGAESFVTNVAPGLHIVAVELHQGGPTSPDAVFGMKITYQIDAPVITEQPQDVTTSQGSEVSFAVTATGSHPRYQWYNGTVAIVGATNRVYIIAAPGLVSDGSRYAVEVSNGGGTVRSRDALLRVEPGPIAPYGLTERATNSTLRFGSPPAFAYQVVPAFPGLTFSETVAIVSPPGETNRLFLLERAGRVIVITNLATPTRSTFMDISPRITLRGECGLLGLAFHPGYATNGFFFLFYSTITTTSQATNSLHQVLSRFQATDPNSAAADVNSEVRLLTMFDETDVHNAGDLHFGSDGYLYVAMADESYTEDSTYNAQSIDRDFWSGILRMDVDDRPENLIPNAHPAIGLNTFRVPADNPFIGVTNWNGSNVAPSSVRTEFYAIGLRNPWRMSFDRLTDTLYCGDVGLGQREEIDVIVRGGNYGWGFREGLLPGPKPQPLNAVAIDPILEYDHNAGVAVIGGIVYRGNRFAELYGTYIYGDWGSRRIWAFRYDGTRVAEWRQIASGFSMTAFGVDPRNGDVLLAGATVGRLIRDPNYETLFPATLTETGIFTNLTTLTPNAGILPYEVNVPGWADGALQSRWFAVPGTIGFDAFGSWRIPGGSTFIQHFDIELTNGVPESRRRIETRVLVGAGTSSLLGATYQWDTSQTNATLVSEFGTAEALSVNEGGSVRTQIWTFPSRLDCLNCHNRADPSRQVFGFNTAQLNRDRLFENGIRDNQIRALNHAGYFGSSFDYDRRHILRALAVATNEEASVEQRVRSQLAVSCAMCHQPNAGNGLFDLRITAPLSDTHLINGALLNQMTNTPMRLVVPGSRENSALFLRVSAVNAGHSMPLATLVNTQLENLVERWIMDELPGYKSFSEWQIAHFGSTNAPGASWADDADADGAKNSLEYLTHTDPLSAEEAWEISAERNASGFVVIYPRIKNRGFEVEWSINLSTSSVWKPVNVPENRPFFSATNGIARVPCGIAEARSCFYRVRVYEP